MIKVYLCLAGISCFAYAKGADTYVESLVFYQEGKYKKAYPFILTEAKRGNKEAQYILGNIYEHGLGVVPNMKNAAYWYKQASSRYTYSTKKTKKYKFLQEGNFLNRLKNQFNYTSIQKGLNFAFSKVDSDNPSIKSTMLKLLENSFGLQPYHTNFIIPISYANTAYKRHFFAYQDTNIPSQFKDGILYDSHIEAQMQLNLQKPLTYNLFGWHEYINFAYTQQVWWKVYDESSPFRETNYTPELFMLLPTSDKMDQSYRLKGIKIGYIHQSNGQEGYRSRSWNRLFVEGIWQFDNVFINLKTWYRIPEERKSEAFYKGIDPNDKGDDNPNISDYMGYGDLTIKYIYGKSQINLLLRNNFKQKDNKGAVRLDWTTPFFGSDNTFWYIRLFSGYAESLIDYDKKVSNIGFGFAFSRGIF